MKNENESSFDNKINESIKLFNDIVSEIKTPIQLGKATVRDLNRL